MTDPQIVWTGTVLPEWIDHNGHMNSGFYMVVFDDAIGPWTAVCGIDREYRTTFHRSSFSIEGHLQWIRELREGDPLIVEAELLAWDDKKIHTFMRLLHAGDGYVAATHEVLSMHIDLRTRRSSPLPPEILDRLAEVKRTQRPLHAPGEVGRVIRTKPWPQQ